MFPVVCGVTSMLANQHKVRLKTPANDRTQRRRRTDGSRFKKPSPLKRMKNYVRLSALPFSAFSASKVRIMCVYFVPPHVSLLRLPYKKLSYRRETARQRPTWRGARHPAQSPAALSGYICVYGRILNPQQTYVKCILR